MLIATGLAAAPGDRSPDDVWISIGADELAAAAPDRVGPTGPAGPAVAAERFAGFALEPSALEAILAAAPLELTPAAESAPAVLTLPRPDGGFERFAVVESPVMHPELARWMAKEGWPMKTYRGTSLDRAATAVRLDWGGPEGFHAMVDSPAAGYFVDPYWPGDRRHYASYLRRNQRRRPFVCGVRDGSDPRGAEKQPPPVSGTTGGSLRTYRLANAAQGEYTAQHGGTQVGGQAAVVTAIHRVNQVYERDLSIRLLLVAGNQNLIYVDSATDPYSFDSCGDELIGDLTLSQNQANLDAVIGPANYDVGHVFNTSGGGLAGVGVVCNDLAKAKACTGRPDPVGDPFWIDYVAHEMGHQFGASHTWNGVYGSCSPSSFSSHSAYEPGSGSTIMAYAGICDDSNGDDNLQANSDPYFHRRSLDQILAFAGGPGTCSVDLPGVNPGAPTAGAGPDFTIPIATPFELRAEGFDSGAEALTFTWEQLDLGTQAPLAAGDDGTGQPIFRSWPPETGRVRVFPRLADLVAGTTPLGETLPATDRTMTFRVTVRDNDPDGGREGHDEMTLTSTTSAGPFEVTFPNGGESLSGEQTVTWNVAGTTAPPVSASSVDILLSTDGGLTYPDPPLAANVTNDGSHPVTLPAVATTSARIEVKAANNVFFDLSDADFEITPPAPSCPAATLGCGESVSAALPGPGATQQIDGYACNGFSYPAQELVYGFTSPVTGEVTVTLTGTAVDLDLFVLADGGSCDGDACIGSSQNLGSEEAVTFAATAGATYSIAVDDFDGTGGAFTLSLDCAPSGEIFADGFESGDTSAWSSAVP